jgi:division protein CdvB (Snf7/Vps24/ESCRT-III family)
MEFRIKQIINQIKELNDSDFESVNKEINEQDLHPKTKTLANSNRRVMALFTQLFCRLDRRRIGF